MLFTNLLGSVYKIKCMCRLFIIIVYRELWFAVSNTIENDNYVFSSAV